MAINHPYSISFNQPGFVGSEMKYIAEAVGNGHLSGDGPFTRKCHQLLTKIQNNSCQPLLTTSCTHALEMSALLLDIKPGDEVILPSFTFVSTANAFVLRGATPRFCDVRPDTLNIDESKIESLINDRTRAIVPVHYAGIGCEMRKIMQLCKKYDLALVEDNAHGLFGKFEGQALGSFGDLATQSFHETKNIQCGEGGALIINKPELLNRAEVIREKGTLRSRFFRGQVDKYTWVDLGSSYLPSDMLAAVLYAQLENYQHIQTERKRVWDYYYDNLKDWASNYKVALPTIPANREQAYHLFYMIMPDLAERTRFIHHMRDQGVQAVYHYLPLHLSEMGRRFGGKTGDCPITEQMSDRLVRLPFYNTLGEDDLKQVVRAVKSFKHATRTPSGNHTVVVQ